MKKLILEIIFTISFIISLIFNIISNDTVLIVLDSIAIPMCLINIYLEYRNYKKSIKKSENVNDN